MAQEYKVTRAFQATVSKEDKTPKSFVNKAGQTLFVWKVQVEGNPNWLNINKQEGNEIKTGDVLYGDITPNQWNTGFDFRSEQRPLGEVPSNTGKQSSQGSSAAVSSDLAEKIDYLVTGMETLLGIRDDALAAFGEPESPKAPTAVPANGLDDLDI